MKPEIQKLKQILDKKSHFPEKNVPEYAVHNDTKIKGFFGNFRFLSNFYPCSHGIWYEGLKYPSVEHAYQAAKVDPSDRPSFITCNTKDVKKMGSNILLDKSDWDKIKYNIMVQLVTQKFSVHDDLRNKLIETKNAYLEETNSWYDFYWGVCENRGQNKLGEILMVVRSFWK